MEDDIMDWFDVIKNVEIDESKLQARELAEDNCCVNIWKSIAQEQPRVYKELQSTTIWSRRKTKEGCSMLIEWLREGAKSHTKENWRINAAKWKFEKYGIYSHSEWIDMKENGIYNQKKGWLQDYVDCYNVKNKTNRPQLEMY